MRVFTSNFSDLEGLKPCYDSQDGEITTGSLRSILYQIDTLCPGFFSRAVSGDQLSTRCTVWRNVLEDDGKLYDGPETRELKDLDVVIGDEEDILVSLFDANWLRDLLSRTLTKTNDKLKYLETRNGAEPELQEKEFKYYLDGEILGPIEEKIYRFTEGTTTLSDLAIRRDEALEIRGNGLTEPDCFDRMNSRMLPGDLVDGLASLWGLDAENLRLRLFQEDALFFLMAKLNKPELVRASSLLLSIPTGGGKTEAFLLPIVAHLLLKKREYAKLGEIPANRVRTIIVYPTKALANDQARRISQILYTCNRNLPSQVQVSVGILTGDTPDTGAPWKLKEENLFQICPNPACGEAQDKFVRLETEAGHIHMLECRHCGETFPYLRLTRLDMLATPPDILITNPDMINFCLQNPRLRQLFTGGVELVVFDEIHLCTSVFGCHVAHLLRRLEESSGRKPVYVGVSATIENAVQVAALLFDTDPADVLYLRDTEERPYQDQNRVDHYRQHFAVRPAEWGEDRYRSTTAASVRMLHVLIHAIRDPHFRKTLAFCNFRQDTDDLVKSFGIQEDRYFAPYQEQIRDALLSKKAVAEPQAALAADGVGRWYEFLNESGRLYNKRIHVGWHRGGLEQKQRISAVNRFATTQQLKPSSEETLPEEPIDLMISTNTLELGIDIGDVTTVLNVGAPHTVNEYTQRVGRGGRRRDSAAVTVINRKNPLDLYFWTHFDEFAGANRNYESAPIIITNDSVVRAHLLARILDYVAEHLGDVRGDIKVADLRSLTVSHGGVELRLLEDPDAFARALFDKIFREHMIEVRPGVFQSALAVYRDWLLKEHEILDVEPNVPTERQIEDLLVNKCRELRDKIDPVKRIWQAEDHVTGLKAKDRSMVPRMRGAGQTVSLYLMRDQEEELKDTISRRQAVQLRPPGGYATQGSNSFVIAKDLKSRDDVRENELRKLFAKEPAVETYFKTQFSDFVSAQDVTFVIPSELWVRYSPHRFYCANSRCGRTYIFYPHEGRCEDCGWEVRQVTEVYVCSKPGCGEIHMPPVPRVCMSPECVAKVDRERGFIRALQRKKPPAYEEYFRFQAYPDLHWRCMNCGLVFNYHNRYTIPLNPDFISMPFSDRNFETAQGVAKHFQYRPEGRAANPESLQKFRLYKAHFSCSACSEGKKIGQVRVSVVPVSRTALVDYILERERLCTPLLGTVIGDIRFHKVEMISLGKERYRTFTNNKRQAEVKSEAIFSEERKYLANFYSTHAAFFTFNNSVEEFLRQDPLGCVAHCDGQGDCGTCPIVSRQGAVDNWEEIRPYRNLLPWEKWNRRNEETGKPEVMPKWPDPRGGWCDIARQNKCHRTDDHACTNCDHFRSWQYYKYILVNSLKHALLLAMPRYTGVDSSQMQGILNPNGLSTPELVIVDAIEDGSGGLFLLQKNWDVVWDMTKEVIRLTAENEGNLLLPHGATRYNKDLCPFITKAYIDFLDQRKR